MDRLKPYREANPNATWVEWINSAYFNKVCLSCTGFYKLDCLNYDWNTNSGNKFNYFSTGAGCTEVEIDCLTGEHKVLRTDIVVDVGKSLNPGIDIGQIEGAFMQGYGLYVLEEVQYSDNGLLRSTNLNNYRIPAIFDIPTQFNVALLKGSSNPKAIYSSKGVGEPPLMLAASVFFAIRGAIESARVEKGIGHSFEFFSPATAKRIRHAIGQYDFEMFTGVLKSFSGEKPNLSKTK